MGLYSVAILKKSRVTEDGFPADQIVYGPVFISGGRCDDGSVIANKVIAQAASEGKLPGGWTDGLYVAGVSYSAFT